MSSALRDALSSQSVISAANKAGFDLNNPTNISRLLTYAGVSGLKFDSEKISETKVSGESLAQSSISTSLMSPELRVASQKAGVNLFDAEQFNDLFGLSSETLAISAAGITSAKQALSGLPQSRVVTENRFNTDQTTSQITSQNKTTFEASAYTKNALKMYAQIAAMA